MAAKETPTVAIDWREPLQKSTRPGHPPAYVAAFKFPRSAAPLRAFEFTIPC